jgi:hypothetical protein
MEPIDLSPGDFVYQSDQEIFLVCIDESENSYKFAVHGWRDIDKERLDEYVSHENGKLYRQRDVTEMVEQEGEEAAQQHFDEMREMFSVYAGTDLSDEGPHTDFSLEDT